MRIGVVGGGAIGLLVAGYLSNTFPITLYVRREEQKDKIKADGLTIENGPDQINHIQIETSDHEWFEDLIIIAVKQPDIPALLKAHSTATKPGQALLFLQNGAAHLGLMNSLRYDHVFIGIVEHGALKKSDTLVIHKGIGEIKIGGIRGDVSIINPLIQVDGLNINIVKEWEQILMQKLLVNTVINPLTALFRVKNGELIQNPHFLKVMEVIFREAINALHFQSSEEQWNHIIQICKNTSDNRSSMLQDFEAGSKSKANLLDSFFWEKV